MVKANLLVTFDPLHKESAKKEIDTIMKDIKTEYKLLKAEEGLAQVSVKNVRKTMKNIVALSKKSKNKINYTYHWWPVDEWCKAEVKDMQKCIAKLQKNIDKDEKWKMDLAKRQTTKDYGRDIIIKLTDVVDKPKVDLDNPEKIIKVEIIGNKAAISVFSKEEFI